MNALRILTSRFFEVLNIINSGELDNCYIAISNNANDVDDMLELEIYLKQVGYVDRNFSPKYEVVKVYHHKKTTSAWESPVVTSVIKINSEEDLKFFSFLSDQINFFLMLSNCNNIKLLEEELLAFKYKQREFIVDFPITPSINPEGNICLADGNCDGINAQSFLCGFSCDSDLNLAAKKLVHLGYKEYKLKSENPTGFHVSDSEFEQFYRCNFTSEMQYLTSS